MGKYYPSRVRAAADGSLIDGWGTPLRPPVEVTEAAWFRTLVREQSNFSFGFNRVRDADVVAGLESLAPAAHEISGELLRSTAEDEQDDDAFHIGNVTDARERVIASMVRRQGQPAFRAALMRAYGSRCAFSGCAVEHVLEAAHIVPYQGEDTNHVQNGLLLRGDLHTLFDLGLVAVDRETLRLLVGPALVGSEYAEMAGRTMRLPQAPECRPSVDALTYHRVRAGL